MTFWILAFVSAALVMGGKVIYSRKAAKRCPTCGGRTRYAEPYFMCDACEDMVGVRLGKTNYLAKRI